MTPTTCRACRKSLAAARQGEYVFCPACGSANYVSTRPAEEENMAYFEENAKRGVVQELAARRNAFSRAERIHRRLHARESRRYESTLAAATQRMTAGRLVEVGFGSGFELGALLRKGVDAYGLDLSEVTVANFKRAYPQWADRVAVGTHTTVPVNSLYSNALFEHLDTPGEFLENARRMLAPEGWLVIRLPIVERRWLARRQVDTDINFWKPCHRVLYTVAGLRQLLREHGFAIEAAAGFNYFGYKVMSRMLAHGISEVEHLRTPLVNFEGLTDDLFNRLLLEALVWPTSCLDYVILAKRSA